MPSATVKGSSIRFIWLQCVDFFSLQNGKCGIFEAVSIIQEFTLREFKPNLFIKHQELNARVFFFPDFASYSGGP